MKKIVLGKDKVKCFAHANAESYEEYFDNISPFQLIICFQALIQDIGEMSSRIRLEGFSICSTPYLLCVYYKL